MGALIMTLNKFIIGALTVLNLSGCASLLNGQEQAITIKSHQKADIYIDGEYAGTGLTTRSVSRDERHLIQVKLNSCETEFKTDAQFNRMSLLGLLVDAGLFSIPIDFFTGAAWSVTPSKVHVPLDCESSQN